MSQYLYCNWKIKYMKRAMDRHDEVRMVFFATSCTSMNIFKLSTTYYLNMHKYLCTASSDSRYFGRILRS